MANEMSARLRPYHFHEIYFIIKMYKKVCHVKSNILSALALFFSDIYRYTTKEDTAYRFRTPRKNGDKIKICITERRCKFANSTDTLSTQKAHFITVIRLGRGIIYRTCIQLETE